MNWYPSSFRARRTLATGVVAALVCIGVSLLFLMFAGGKEADHSQALATGTWNRVVPLVRQGHLPSVLQDGKGVAIQVLDAHDRVVSATRQLVGKPPMATFRSTSEDVRAARVLCPPAGLKGCMTVVSYKIYQPDGVWLLYLAVPVVPWYGDTTALFLAIGVSLLVITMMTAWTFRDLTKALLPVNAIRMELAEITATGLHRRVPVPGKYEEIKCLAETVNDTLDRLEGAYQQLRRFTSDASHDLRSPITAMRAQLEEALMYPRDTDWPKMTEAVLTGVERLQAIVTDLLALARLDAGAPLLRDATDLGRLVDAELSRRTYRVKIVKDLGRNVFICCDRLRITRVLVNLLDNAERHAELADHRQRTSRRADGDPGGRRRRRRNRRRTPGDGLRPLHPAGRLTRPGRGRDRAGAGDRPGDRRSTRWHLDHRGQRTRSALRPAPPRMRSPAGPPTRMSPLRHDPRARAPTTGRIARDHPHRRAGRFRTRAGAGPRNPEDLILERSNVRRVRALWRKGRGLPIALARRCHCPNGWWHRRASTRPDGRRSHLRARRAFTWRGLSRGRCHVLGTVPARTDRARSPARPLLDHDPLDVAPEAGDAEIRRTGTPRPARAGRPGHHDQTRSNRSRFITLSHAATKSFTNFSFASSLA